MVEPSLLTAELSPQPVVGSKEAQLRPLQLWCYGLIMPRVLNRSHLPLERKAMVPLSAWWSRVHQPCMNVAEESCCPQRFSSPNTRHGRVFVGLEASRSVLGTPAAGQCRVQPARRAHPAQCCATGNWKQGNVSWRGRTHRKFGLGRVRGVLWAGQRGIPGWMLSPLFRTLPPLGGHCLLAVAATSASSFARLLLCLSLLPACVPKGSER